MIKLEELLKELQEGRSVLMPVPPNLDIDLVVVSMMLFGLEHGMELSIMPMISETDQKLAIGPGSPVESADFEQG